MPVMAFPRRRRLALGAACAWLALAGHDAARAAGERERLVRILRIEPGDVVADVGAGEGEWAVGLAAAVGSAGRVWATEVDEEALAAMRRRVADAGLSNVAVVAGTQSATGLPERCCDAILLRMVYHHFTEPEAMRRDLLRALRPGGLLLVVDIVPQEHWSALPGTPERGGHGIVRSDLLAEMTAAGFEVVSVHDAWNDDPERYGVLLRRPLSEP